MYTATNVVSNSVLPQSEESGGSDPDSDSDSTDLVLKNISMSITPGEKIAICGRSGR